MYTIRNFVFSSSKLAAIKSNWSYKIKRVERKTEYIAFHEYFKTLGKHFNNKSTFLCKKVIVMMQREQQLFSFLEKLPIISCSEL